MVKSFNKKGVTTFKTLFKPKYVDMKFFKSKTYFNE